MLLQLVDSGEDYEPLQYIDIIYISYQHKTTFFFLGINSLSWLLTRKLPYNSISRHIPDLLNQDHNIVSSKLTHRQ